MPRAIWKGTVIAEAPTEKCEIVENNVYFPPDAVKKEFFTDSGTHTVCPWKGTASYYNVEVGGEKTPMPPGTTRRPKMPPKISRITWRSGEASRSKNN
jgi:uncharacterized protein (DUF427 family)